MVSKTDNGISYVNSKSAKISHTLSPDIRCKDLVPVYHCCELTGD